VTAVSQLKISDSSGEKLTDFEVIFFYYYFNRIPHNGMKSINVIASQAKTINRFRNLRTKVAK